MSKKEWGAATVALMAAGCSMTPPTVNQHAVAPTAQATRAIMATNPVNFSKVAKNLPTRLTNEQAAKMLVQLPSDKIKGQLQLGTGRSTQALVGLGGVGLLSYLPYGQTYIPYAYSQAANCWQPYSFYGMSGGLGNWYYPYYYNTLGAYYPYTYEYPYSFWGLGVGSLGGVGFTGRRGFTGRGFGGRMGGRGMGGRR